MISLSTGLRNAMLNASGFKEVFTNAVIYMYSGAMPTDADQPVSGTLLGKVTKDGGAFAFGSGTNGLNFDAPASGIVSKAVAEDWEFTGIANGIVGWVRLMGNATDSLGSSTTLPRMDIAVGASGTNVIVFSTTSIEEDVPGTVDVFQFGLPVR